MSLGLSRNRFSFGFATQEDHEAVLNPLSTKPQLLCLKNGGGNTYFPGPLSGISKLDLFRICPSSGFSLQWLPTSFQMISKSILFSLQVLYTTLPFTFPSMFPEIPGILQPQGLCTFSSLSGLLFPMCHQFS